MKTRILSAGIVPVRKHNDGWLYLLLRAYAYWDFPKGIVENGEDPHQAALRELGEETGISQAQFHWGYDYNETPPYSRGKVARYYLAEVTKPELHLLPHPSTGRVEHHEFRWLGYKEARKLLVPRCQAILDWAQNRIESE